MKRVEFKVSFNIEWAKKAKRSDFIKNHEKAYPDLNLGEIHDEIMGRNKLAKVEEKKV